MIIAIDRDHKGAEVWVTLAAARRVSELVAVRHRGWEIARVLEREGHAPPTGVARWAAVSGRTLKPWGCKTHAARRCS